MAAAVDDNHLYRVRRDTDVDGHVRARRMFGGVGEALLEDAVHSQADDAFDVVERPVHGELHIGAGRRRRCDQLRYVSSGRCRRRARSGPVSPQDGDVATDLGQAATPYFYSCYDTEDEQ